MIKFKNVNILNLFKGFWGIGSMREYLTDPDKNKELRHEISQYRNKHVHGCTEVYYPISGTQRRMENFFQLRNGKKFGFFEDYHKSTGIVCTRITFLNDLPHGWREVFNEGGELIERELYENGKKINLPS